MNRRHREDDDTVVLPAVGGQAHRPSPGPRQPGGPAQHRARRPTGGDRVRAAMSVTGELLITLGVVVLLFVAYEVYVTDWVSHGKQRDATVALDDSWAASPTEAPAAPERTEQFRPGDGEGFAKIYIPAFGSDFVFTVLEGTSDRVLEIGPGHYRDTAFPGEPGNFAVAGHRVGKGAPFNDLHLLRSCDALVVETQHNWLVYRVLPMAGEAAGWARRQAENPRCESVNPLGSAYSGVLGRHIVRPTQNDVIAAVPGRADLAFESLAPEQRATLITLTTCHPQFSAKERLIVHGVFAKGYPKDPANPTVRPPELTEG